MSGKGLLDAFMTPDADDAPSGFDKLRSGPSIEPAAEPVSPAGAAAEDRSNVKKSSRAKPAPKQTPSSVKRMRDRTPRQPTVPFAQRVTEETAEAFYTFAAEHNLSMKDTLARAAEALLEKDAHHRKGEPT